MKNINQSKTNTKENVSSGVEIGRVLDPSDPADIEAIIQEHKTIQDFKSTSNHLLKILKTARAGFAVVSTQNIKAGTIICTCRGKEEWITEENFEKKEKHIQNYAFEVERKHNLIRMYFLHEIASEASLINGNYDGYENVKFNFFKTDSEMQVIALRDICTGEELLANYGKKYCGSENFYHIFPIGLRTIENFFKDNKMRYSSKPIKLSIRERELLNTEATHVLIPAAYFNNKKKWKKSFINTINLFPVLEGKVDGDDNFIPLKDQQFITLFMYCCLELNRKMINILKVSDNICFITHQGCSAWSIITGNLEESDQLCCKIAESIQNIYQRNNWLQAYPKYLQDNKASSSLTVIPNPPELTPLDKDSKEGNHGASLSPQAISFDSHPSPESLRPAEPVILPICTNVQDIAEIADNLNNKNELEEIKNPTAITEPALKISPKETNISKALINSETIPLSIDTNTKANTGTMVMPTYLPIPLLLPQTQYWELSTLIPPLEWQYLPHIFKFQHPLQSSIPQFNPVKNSELTQSPALKPDKETKRLGHRNVPSREEDFRSLRFLRDIDGFQNATAEDFTVLVRNSCYNRLRTMTRSASNALPRLEATLYKNWTQEKVNKMIVSITPIRVNSHYSNSQTPTSRDLLKDLTVKVLIKFQSYFLSNGWQYKDFNIKGIKNPFSYINNRDNALSEAMLLFLDLRGTKHSITFFNSSSVPSENLGKTQPLAPSEYPRKKIKCTHANSADVNNQSQSICLKFQT